jgi:hypothetical protein
MTIPDLNKIYPRNNDQMLDYLIYNLKQFI